jgi:putative heme-binding domain-containing protein
LGRWDTCTPPLRTEIVEAMLTRPDRIAALFDAIEAGRIAPSYVSATRKGLLLRHDNPTIRSRAAALFQSEAVSPRNEVITRYRSALELPTDRGRGQRVFERECKSCHRLGDQGSEVGPDLAASLHHAPDQILMNILDPNREVSPNYLEYVVALEDGRVLTGVIANETATNITLRRAEGVQDVVLRKDIADMRSSGKSLMPEGLENKITGQEMADLLAFLVSGSR